MFLVNPMGYERTILEDAIDPMAIINSPIGVLKLFPRAEEY